VQFNVGDRKETLTVSIGVASRGPATDDYKTVLKKANEGKAEAKRPRNIVVAIEKSVTPFTRNKEWTR
jgi:PleD family two-component response regulator